MGRRADVVPSCDEPVDNLCQCRRDSFHFHLQLCRIVTQLDALTNV
jgi:hypothetical protein